jgi:hypothetical protein
MPYLALANNADLLSLNMIDANGTGLEAGPGVAGLGMPPVATQWIEGAGDGSLYRGRRILPRDVDIPIQISAPDRAGLEGWLSRLYTMLAAPCEIRWVLDDGEYWAVRAAYTGDSGYATGADTNGDDFLKTVITLRAGDPLWKYSRAHHIEAQVDLSRGLLDGGSLAELRVSTSQLQAEVTVDNTGDAPTWPLWEVTGPAQTLTVVAGPDAWFEWGGTLTAGQRLVINAQARTVIDGTGANRYGELAAGPRFFHLPPGKSRILLGANSIDESTRVLCRWWPKRWGVV